MKSSGAAPGVGVVRSFLIGFASSSIKMRHLLIHREACWQREGRCLLFCHKWAWGACLLLLLVPGAPPTPSMQLCLIDSRRFQGKRWPSKTHPELFFPKPVNGDFKWAPVVCPYKPGHYCLMSPCFLWGLLSFDYMWWFEFPTCSSPHSPYKTLGRSFHAVYVYYLTP